MRYVFVDRDGVINKDSDAYIKSPEEWKPIPGSMEALSTLYKNGFSIVVITNQSGLGRGLYDRKTLCKIHEKMHRCVERAGGKIESIYFCPHVPEDHCDCRKPKPGLLKAFAKDKKACLKNIPFVGDAWIDVKAALAVGAKPLLVKTGKDLTTCEAHPAIKVPVFENLLDAAQYILEGQ